MDFLLQMLLNIPGIEYYTCRRKIGNDIVPAIHFTKPTAFFIGKGFFLKKNSTRSEKTDGL